MSVHYHFAALGSTNSRAVELARLGEPAPFWVTADRQLAGRGRMDRNWVSEPGNLYASLLLAPDVELQRLPELSFVFAVALRRAVSSESGLRSLKLKWPNDLMAGHEKFAGLLLESSESQGRVSVVAGFGVNCAHHPSGTRTPAADLAVLGTPVATRSLFEALRTQVASAIESWLGEGFRPFREEWADNAYGIGREACISTGSRVVRGEAEGIDDAGRLVLTTKHGREYISAGDWLVTGTDERLELHG